MVSSSNDGSSAGGRDRSGTRVEADSLDALLNHLQGNSPLQDVDAGLARLSQIRLADIQAGAQRRADGCLEDMRNTARLLLQTLQEIPAPPDVLRPLTMAVEMLEQRVEDARRWQQLADSARRYRTQPGVAERVSLRWARSARSRGELPEP